jgi:peptidoglycan/xylan/chitin deacetylase (PgdA/CDA1 family)
MHQQFGTLARWMDQRKLIRELCRVVGVSWYAWRALRSGLYVFNYHRIGDAETTAFDPNVFSASVGRLAEHVRLIRSRFDVVDVSRLLSIIENGTALHEPIAMITFDDGYRDNYAHALPVLRATRTPAVFFVPVGYIGRNHVAWWDEVAWMAGDADEAKLTQVPWLRGLSGQQPRARRIQQVLQAFKQSRLPSDVKLQQLREATGRIFDPSRNDRLFMDWEEIRTLRRSGMDIGSHTNTHEILSHLTPAEQRAELQESKRVLEAQLGEPIQTLAYPVGTSGSYTVDTMAIARACGYRAAFTFVSGINEHPAANRFELRRMAVADDPDAETLRFSTVIASVEASQPGRLGQLRRGLHWASSRLRERALRE